MADADREIGVKVTTSADTSGLQQADKETQKLSKTTDQAGDAAEKATTKKNRLKDVVKGLAVEFPQLARVVGFATNPITIITAAVTTATGKFLEWTRSIEAAGRKQAELETLRDSLTSIKTLMQQMEAAKFTKAIDEIGTAANKAVTELDKLNRKLDETRRRADELENLETEVEEQNIDSLVASGKMTESEARKAKADLHNKRDEAAAQREYQALVQKKKNQENTLRDIEPQISRLQYTPDEDLAKMKDQLQRAKLAAAAASKALDGEQDGEGKKLKTDMGDAQAALEGFRKTGHLTLGDRWKFGQDFGITAGLQDPKEIEGRITEFIESKQREYDSLVKTKHFEEGKAQKIENRISGATQENAQIESLRKTQDDLRQGVKDTDEEINTTTKFNRRKLQLKRTHRNLEVETKDADDDRKVREQEEKKANRAYERAKEQNRTNRARGGADVGGADVSGLASVDTSAIQDSGTEVAEALGKILAAVTESNAEILAVIGTHADELHILKQRIAENEV